MLILNRSVPYKKEQPGSVCSPNPSQNCVVSRHERQHSILRCVAVPCCFLCVDMEMATQDEQTAVPPRTEGVATTRKCAGCPKRGTLLADFYVHGTEVQYVSILPFLSLFPLIRRVHRLRCALSEVADHRCCRPKHLRGHLRFMREALQHIL